ncbi:peptidoglycan binding domain-containing protein [Auriculariales sp. MPI-PUGE-AT-0066]|nr:peptidoglycan binding domain-containing protein [Auriculariales sp. MPI-PUGE-AT-0066]
MLSTFSRCLVAATVLLGTLVVAQDYDPKVYQAQTWLNSVYGGRAGFNNAPENGKTGWPTMYAFTRALQLEVGITSPADNFGDGTLAAVTSKLGEVGDNSPTNVIKIVQGALYCKGYSGGDLSGAYADSASSVLSMRHNMGFTDSKSTLSPKEFKALLTMDAYVVVAGGRSIVRDVQMWMNFNYISQSWFYIIPTDGFFGRTVQQMLVRMIQMYFGITTTGEIGSLTRAAIMGASTVSFGSTGTYTLFYEAAIIFNGYNSAFGQPFGQGHSDALIDFQQFYKLPVIGAGNGETFLSLLISPGNPDRAATGLDCSKTVTAARGALLYSQGYRVVGRYLSNVPGSTFNKKIQPGELSDIFNAGLRVFPIFQTYGENITYFTNAQGKQDAREAVDASLLYGFSRGTPIYFAVDMDATDADIDNGIIPYFQGINLEMSYLGNKYKIGSYASRNPCTRLYKAGLADLCFSSDMSFGYSGNLGYGLSPNWAFSQFAGANITGSNGVWIDIDKNAVSGRDNGVSSVQCVGGIDTNFNSDYKSALYDELVLFFQTRDPTNQLGLIHSLSEALDKVLEHDAYITSLANAYGMRKTLVQTPVFWEYYKQTAMDPVGDARVTSYYAYKIAYEGWEATDDSSTGVAQIFAKTAILAYNYGRSVGLTNEKQRNVSNWHDMWDVWQALHNDERWNIRTVPLVLLNGAAEYNIPGPRVDYSAAEITQILQRYNGYGDGAVEYGKTNYGVYSILEYYNAKTRGGSICA